MGKFCGRRFVYLPVTVEPISVLDIIRLLLLAGTLMLLAFNLAFGNIAFAEEDHGSSLRDLQPL